MKRALLILALGFVLATPARAEDVTRLPFGQRFDALVAGPDGSVWTRVAHGPGDVSVGHAGPDGVYRQTHAGREVFSLAVGPDGLAWFSFGTSTFLRADARGALGRPVTLPEAAGSVGYLGSFATGPDGTLWVPLERRIAHVTSGGVISFSTFARQACEPGYYGYVYDLARASDGAMWFADAGCHRLLRRASGGTWAAVALGADNPQALAPDNAGGVWYQSGFSLAHADAAGAVTRVPMSDPLTSVLDVAVAPDGVAWFTIGRCRLGRVTPGGAVTFTPAPVPAERLAFAPDGTLWLASRARLVRGLTASEPCDEEGPRARVTPARSVSLAMLARRGVRFTVREPARMSLFVPRFEAGGETLRRTLRYRPSARALRLLRRSVDRRGRTSFIYVLEATDVNGNAYHTEGSIEVTR